MTDIKEIEKNVEIIENEAMQAIELFLKESNNIKSNKLFGKPSMFLVWFTVFLMGLAGTLAPLCLSLEYFGMTLRGFTIGMAIEAFLFFMVFFIINNSNSDG